MMWAIGNYQLSGTARTLQVPERYRTVLILAVGVEASGDI